MHIDKYTAFTLGKRQKGRTFCPKFNLHHECPSTKMSSTFIIKKQHSSCTSSILCPKTVQSTLICNTYPNVNNEIYKVFEEI